MANLLDQAMSPEGLNSTWKRLNKDPAPWSVQVTNKDLNRDTLLHLLRCREQVLLSRYLPQPLRKFTLPKPNGKKRVLSAQFLQDKFVQRALLTVLQPRAEQIFHNNSYAYRPNRGVGLALQKTREQIRIGLDWVVSADIVNFFDSIPHPRLKRVLASFINDKPTMHLVNEWLAIGYHQSSFIFGRRGIAQGAVLSPLMCNLFLHQFDLALDKANIPFVRYADDFLLFAPTKQYAEKAKEVASQELDKLGLQLHPIKTSIERSSPSVIFLGQGLPKTSR
jgi:group II intron reverse transcriptase/maturase